MLAAQPDPTLERSFRGHKDAVTSLSFNPNLKQLASGGLDNAVICYNFKAGMRAFKFIGHKGPVYSVCFHPVGNLLASASGDQCVKLWTPNVKGDVATLKAHSNSVRSVHFSGDGLQLMTGSDDKSVKVWSTHRARFQYSLNGHLNWVRSAKFSPDDKLGLSGGDDKVLKLWDLTSRTCARSYFEHTGMITDVAFHPSGHLIASCSSDRSIKVWDIRTHKLLQHYADAHGSGEGLSGIVNSIAFGGRAGEWLISTGGDGLIKIWDLQEGHLFFTLYGHKVAPTTAAVFSHDEIGGAYFATAGADAQVMLWKANFNLKENFDSEKIQQQMNSNVNRHSRAAVLAPSNQDNYSVSSIKANVDSRKVDEEDALDVGEAFILPSASKTKSAQEAFYPKPTEPHSINPDSVDPSVKTVHIAPLTTTIPEMTTALTQIVHQLDILTQTMSIIEDRLSAVEDRAFQPIRKEGVAQSEQDTQ